MNIPANYVGMAQKPGKETELKFKVSNNDMIHRDAYSELASALDDDDTDPFDPGTDELEEDKDDE